MKTNITGSPTAPWWKFGYVWFVLGGPALVVLASFVTFYLAVTRPDEVVTDDYYRKSSEISDTRSAENAAASLAPALQARNHAQTGVAPKVSASVKP